MSKRCLVTGGLGFIGSHLVEGLVAQGWTVRVLDDLSTGQTENLAAVANKVEIVRGDVRDRAVVEKAAEGMGVIFHLAAIASVQQSLEQPMLFHEVLATGTMNVLEACRKHGVKRIVYAGSASAYGLPEGEVQSEDTPLQPLSPYAAGKLAGEMYLRAYAACFGVETVRLRFFNIYGPRQRADSPYSGVIAIFGDRMRKGTRPTVFGDGLQSRDFTEVTDVVQALTKAATVPGISGNVYNVGTGRSVTLLDLVAALNTVLGTSLEPVHAAPRSGEVRFSRADIRRTMTELGYTPSVEFVNGLRRVVQPS